MLTAEATLTPLDPWIAAKIGQPADALLDLEVLRNYQLEKLRTTIDHVRTASPFYRERLAGFAGGDLSELGDLAGLPFTTPADILQDDLRFVCVGQREIERVVTLFTSATTSQPKRVHFTAEDLELTVDFFHQGMSTLVSPGQRVLILMPGELPGSVGDLLAKGLDRLGVKGIQHGIVHDERATVGQIVELGIDCLVGLPVQVLALARHSAAADIPPGQIKSVLLSADYVPASIVAEIERLWGCPVFNHYGMTETGLGGAVECDARDGCHIREADLYFEIVDPASGDPVPDGQLGEVVVTTLTRRGMPLVRYRTGDLARLIAEPCACGTALRRLARVEGRLAARASIGGGRELSIVDLDEALFPLPGLLNFQAVLARDGDQDVLQVSLYAETSAVDWEALAAAARRALDSTPVIHSAVLEGSLQIAPIARSEDNWLASGTVKRTLRDTRED